MPSGCSSPRAAGARRSPPARLRSLADEAGQRDVSAPSAPLDELRPMKKSLLATLITTAAVLAAAPMAGAADDYFLKINGISGDQAAGKLTDAIKVKSFDFGVENKMSIGSATGGA